MNDQSLDWSASSSRAARRAAGPRPSKRAGLGRVRASPPGRARPAAPPTGDRRPAASPRCAGPSRCPTTTPPAAAPRGSWRSSAAGRVVSARPRASACRDHLLEPPRPLVPPVAEQLGVERADDQRGPPARGPVGVARARSRARRSRARARARAPRRASWSYGAPPLRPRAHPVDRLRVVVAVDGIGGIAALVPHERDRLPVERHRDRAAGRHRLELVERVAVMRSGRRRRRARPRPPAAPRGPGGRRTRAARTRRSSSRSARGARRCRSQPAAAGPARSPAAGSTACVAADAHSSIAPASCRSRSGAEQVAAAALEVVRRPLVVARRAPQRSGLRRGGPPLSRPSASWPMAFAAHVAHEAQRTARPSSGTASWSASTGVTPTVATSARAALGRALEHPQQRQVGGRDRLQQPLLAEGPGAEPLDVGHVRVQHDRELAAIGGAARAHGRHTASRSSARSSSPCAQRRSRARRSRARSGRRTAA